MDFRRGQIDIRGHDVKVLEIRMLDDVVWIDGRVEQGGVHGVVHGVRVDAEADRSRALRVEIDDQHTTAVLAERAGNIDGAGGLTDAAFLIAHRDDARRPVLMARLWRRKRLIFSSQ